MPEYRRRHRALLVATFIVAMVAGAVPHDAHAVGSFELYGGGNSQAPFSGSYRIADATVVYKAPSLLPLSRPVFEWGFFFSLMDLSIDYRLRPGEADIQDSIYNAYDLPDGIRPLDTASLQRPRGSVGNDAHLYYITLGTVRHIVPRWITLGLSSMVPTAMFQSQEPHFADHRDQYFSNSLDFELLGDRTKNAQFVMALGSQPLSWLSLGMGVTLSTHARTRTSVFVSEATGKAPPLVAPNISIQSAFVPHASFTLLPLDGLLVTGAFHWKYSNPVHTDHRQTMWYSGGKDDAATSYTYTFDYGFQPIRGSLGVSYQVPDRSGVSLTLATGVRYSLWSQYRDRMGQAPTLPWKNTLSPSLGLAGVFAKVHQVHLDSLYVPSPVPQQTGRSNYVDNHRLALAAAYRFTFPMGSRTGSVSAHVQVHRLIRRSHTKDISSADPVIDEFPEARDARTGEIIPDSLGFQTNNPGYPGFSSEGTIVSTGLSFAVGF